MRLIRLAIAAIVSLSSAPSFAQTYPDHPLKLIVPFVPGGVVDVAGRALARRLEVQLGQPVVVENRPGAGAQVGTVAVANAAPDGYTLMVVDPSVTTTPALQANPPYQMKQLKALGTLTTAPLIVIVHPSLPITNLRELIDYSKKSPEGVTFASAGIGTTPHLAPELLKVQNGFNATHIPYKGGAASIPDMVSGRVHSGFYSNAVVLPLVADGRMRAIAQTGSRRTPSHPQVPTAVESGFPDFVVDLWTAVFAQPGLPPDVEKRLEAEIKKAVESEEFVAAIQKSGLELFYKDGPAARKFVQDEYDRWGSVIKAAKITAE